MSVYTYPESKVVDEITFRESGNGALRAYIHAGPAANEQALRDVTSALQQKGWQCIPHTLEGKPTLEVRGFTRGAQITGLLSQKGWAKGAPSIHNDVSDKIGFTDKMKKRSLQISGLFYGVGDLAFIGKTIKSSNAGKGEALTLNAGLDLASGAFYAFPTPVLWVYGRNDQSQFEVQEIAKKLQSYLEAEHIKLPESCSMDAITADHKKGLLKTTDDLFARYPSEFMSGCYGIAGACIGALGVNYLLKGAPVAKDVNEMLKHLKATDTLATEGMAHAAVHKTRRQLGWLDLGIGASTVSAGAVGTFVDEKKKDPDSPSKGGLTDVWEWVQEKPLAIAGVGLMVSTLLHAASSMVAVKSGLKKDEQAGWMRMTFVACSLIAELLVAISSKGHGKGVVSDRSVDVSAISLAADLIVKQPQAMQDGLIDHMAMFLGRPDVLAMKDNDVRTELQREVESLRKNPWAKTDTPVADRLAVSSNSAAAKPAWLARIAESDQSQLPAMI